MSYAGELGPLCAFGVGVEGGKSDGRCCYLCSGLREIDPKVGSCQDANNYVLADALGDDVGSSSLC